MSPFAPHDFDDDAVCNHCGFDGAEASWLDQILRSEIGPDEFDYRREHGEIHNRPCTKLKEPA